MYREIVIIIVFLAGLIFCFSGKHHKKTMKENFIGSDNCPNLLLQSGTEIFLFNTNRANIPGVNPIKFKNLDEYVEFMKWQRQVGIKCPVLYLQHTYDAQNNLGWRPLNNPLEPNAGMLSGPLSGNNQETLLYDANRLDPPYNEADFPSYDPQNQYIGDTTPLDKMRLSHLAILWIQALFLSDPLTVDTIRKKMDPNLLNSNIICNHNTHTITCSHLHSREITTLNIRNK